MQEKEEYLQNLCIVGDNDYLKVGLDCDKRTRVSERVAERHVLRSQWPVYSLVADNISIADGVPRNKVEMKRNSHNGCP